MAVGLITSPAAWVNGTVAPATWFQNVQDTINGLYASQAGTGNGTFKSLEVDGIGGQAITVAPGMVSTQQLALTQAVFSSVVPTPAGVRGVGGIESPLFGALLLDFTGGVYVLSRALNVAAWTKNATGILTFNLVTPASFAGALAVIVTPAYFSAVRTANPIVFDTDEITIRIHDAAGAAADAPFSALVYHL